MPAATIHAPIGTSARPATSDRVTTPPPQGSGAEDDQDDGHAERQGQAHEADQGPGGRQRDEDPTATGRR